MKAVREEEVKLTGIVFVKLVGFKLGVMDKHSCESNKQEMMTESIGESEME